MSKLFIFPLCTKWVSYTFRHFRFRCLGVGVRGDGNP